MAEAPLRQRTYLFTDFRHIQPGDLQWLGPDGQALPVGYATGPQPLGPPVDAVPRPRFQPHGIRLQAQPAQKLGPLEGLPGDLVLHDGGRYRSWYWRGEGACSAESDDAFAWRPPTAGGGADGGGGVGASVFRPPAGQSHFDGFCVFPDPHARSDERHKLVYMAQPPAADAARLAEQFHRLHPRHHNPGLESRVTRGEVYAVYGAVSPDGLGWTALPEPLLLAFTDTPTTVYYDPGLGRYVLYTRWFQEGRRWIARGETEDFRRWPPLQPLLWPRVDESPGYDLYTNARTPYPDEPAYHLMFPMVYERRTQASHVRLYASADGLVWNEAPGGPVVRPGAPGEWDLDFIHVGRGLVPLGGDRLGARYLASAFPHKFPRWPDLHRLQPVTGGNGWVWWPRGRLSAVVADEEGEFFTFPLLPAGRELRLNFRARRGGGVWIGVLPTGAAERTRSGWGGGVWVEARDHTGRGAADCDHLFGDALAQPVRWRGQSDLGVDGERPVILHFRLRAAEVFGFEWA